MPRTHGEKDAPSPSATRRVAVAAAVAAIVAAAWALNGDDRWRTLLEGLRGLGAWGPLLFVVLYSLGVVLFVPSVVLSLAAGALFGFLPGLGLSLAGAALGALTAFQLGRTLARRPVERALADDARFQALERAVRRRGAQIVLLARLTPVFPFSIANYGFGLSSLSARAYGLASLVGTIPSNAVYVYAGSLSGSLAAATAGGRERSAAEWALLALGGVATVTLSVVLRRIAQRELARDLEAD